MKFKHLLAAGFCALAILSSCTGAKQPAGPIVTDVPERPAGQEDMLAFAAPAIDTVRVGFIGLGMRGPSAVDRYTHIPGVEIVALCDLDSANVEKSQKILDRAGLPRAAAYSGSEDAWKELVARPDLDLVYICTDWLHHTPMALEAMNQGKHVAIEVPSAMDLDEIWALINTSEKTRKHCMMLENCVYDFFEMNTLNMAQQGLFGEPVHVEGAYIHNLEPYWHEYWNNWRLDYNQKHRGDVYATHGMGPAAQLLDIHRGDRMTTLVAMDSDPFTGPSIVEEITGQKTDSFANGDHTTTLIRTAKGKTIQIQHDVMNPRPYNRMYQLTGTKGFANKYPVEQYAFEPSQLDSASVPDYQNLNAHAAVSPEQMAALMAKYQHPIITEVGEIA